MEMAALTQDFSSIRAAGVANNLIHPIGVGIPDETMEGDRTIDHVTPKRDSVMRLNLNIANI